jgi:hypothetical protein
MKRKEIIIKLQEIQEEIETLEPEYKAALVVYGNDTTILDVARRKLCYAVTAIKKTLNVEELK